jgi:YHS domain-containing protein
MKNLSKALSLAIALAILTFAGGLSAQHAGHDHAATAPDAADTDKRLGDAYPLDTCITAGMKLGSMGAPVVLLHERREVRFCCAGCIPKFKNDPAPLLAKADAQIIKDQKPLYPLDHCIVDTDEKLSADESENSYHVIGNRLFIFCCPPCEKDVLKDPAKYFAILDKAAADKQRADYPLSTCVVSGQPLDAMGEPFELVHAGRLVRLCCEGCVKDFDANPPQYMAKIAEAAKAKTE